MKKTVIFIILFLNIASFLIAENWKTIKETKTDWQSITFAESDTNLCTVAISTTYSDGVVIFYIHAGIRDKQILSQIYDKTKDSLSKNPQKSIVEFTSNYVNELKNDGTIYTIYFNTDPTEYTTLGVPCVKSHLYCSSWFDGF